VADVLDASRWRARAHAHRCKVARFLEPRRADQPHPVWDFLFSYYTLRPGQLSCWHPGYDVVLAGDDALRCYRGRRGYTADHAGVRVSGAYLHSRLDTVRFVAELLRTTSRRPAALNCFGLHEWAMVYRSDDVRHRQVPLRLGASGSDALVDSMALRCSHFDAYRFFTDRAVPRNAGAPSRATLQQWEQPGCLHTNMDLYKWCYKLSPLIDSELLLDCLQLAAAAREIDMRAGPYDLSDYGYSPIAVENRAGRAEYVRCQSEIAQRAGPLRESLLARCDLLLQAAECG
jgi:hypothetical protein